jgi:hypothetical protein
MRMRGDKIKQDETRDERETKNGDQQESQQQARKEATIQIRVPRAATEAAAGFLESIMGHLGSGRCGSSGRPSYTPEMGMMRCDKMRSDGESKRERRPER